jgi:hypothetical protein
MPTSGTPGAGRTAAKITADAAAWDDAWELGREAQAGVSLGPRLDAVVGELVHLGQTAGFGPPGASGAELNPRVRDLGVRLFEMGGRKLMQAVAYRVRARRAGANDLEAAWGLE